MCAFLGKMSYSCAPCNNIFSGIKPYTDHINSEKHKKKIKDNTNSVNVPEIGPQMPFKDLDPYIKQYRTAYNCLLCNIILNSLQQAQTHAVGKNHLKMLMKNPVRCTDMVSSVPSKKSNDELPYTFTFYNMKIENVTADIKVFDINDPVCF